ncbi:MAG: hypothetical protein MJ016_02935 [Victivallaceae bacterium]|nr:hypothetical protein [Victivallaceae bacterium]
MFPLILNARDFDFCWTVRRRRYWRTCRRKYFFYDYGARGGNEADAPRETRELYAAKKRMMLEEYIRRVLNLSMREIFSRPNDDEEAIPVPTLAETALRRAEMEFTGMLEGTSPVTILELTRSDADLAAVHGRMKERLVQIATALERSGWGFFRNVPFADRRYPATPLEVFIAELKCVIAPLFAVRRAVDLWLVEGAGHADDGDEIAVLGKFAAAKLWNAPPDRVRSFIFPEDGAENFLEIGSDADVSEVLRGIRCDVDGMLSRIRDDGTIRESDFPADRSACGTCVFASFCRGREGIR